MFSYYYYNASIIILSVFLYHLNVCLYHLSVCLYLFVFISFNFFHATSVGHKDIVLREINYIINNLSEVCCVRCVYIEYLYYILLTECKQNG